MSAAGSLLLVDLRNRRRTRQEAGKAARLKLKADLEEIRLLQLDYEMQREMWEAFDRVEDHIDRTPTRRIRL